MQPTAPRIDNVVSRLQGLADPDNVRGMARFGINVSSTLGISVPSLRSLAREFGRNHDLALGLWATGIREARILAAFVDIPSLVTEEQMERWVIEFDSWDVCDQVCGNLFDRLPCAHNKAVEWSERGEEFVKRAGYVLMATLAVHDKKATDDQFRVFFPLIVRASDDPRNFVKKAVNWALRQIGKRNGVLRIEAIEVAEQLVSGVDKTGRWIGKDALRDLVRTP